MASIPMTASFLGRSAVGAISKRHSATSHRQGAIVAKASKVSEGVSFKDIESSKEEMIMSINGRREMVFAAAAAAVCSMAGVALADEPKKGTPEAKKKYAPICVTMPTARICHK